MRGVGGDEVSTISLVSPNGSVSVSSIGYYFSVGYYLKKISLFLDYTSWSM